MLFLPGEATLLALLFLDFFFGLLGCKEMLNRMSNLRFRDDGSEVVDGGHIVDGSFSTSGFKVITSAFSCFLRDWLGRKDQKDYYTSETVALKAFSTIRREKVR